MQVIFNIRKTISLSSSDILTFQALYLATWGFKPGDQALRKFIQDWFNDRAEDAFATVDSYRDILDGELRAMQ